MIDTVAGTHSLGDGGPATAAFAPARPGDILTLYATGFGATSPAFQAGELPQQIAPTVEKVSLWMAGLELAPSDLLYAGVAPALAGVYQINLRVPATAPDGDLPVNARVGAFATPVGAYLTVKRE